MTPKQKATYWMLAIHITLANVVYFGYFYHEPFSFSTLWTFIIVSVYTVLAHLYFLQIHVFLQYLVPNKEPMIQINEIPSFMDSEHFYYESNYQIRLGENAPPELIKEVNDYIHSYNEWLEEWQRNKYKVSGE
jgi:hypothetical protein